MYNARLSCYNSNMNMSNPSAAKPTAILAPAPLPEKGKGADLTVYDVSAELGLHDNTVRRLIGVGIIPAYRAGLRAWRVRRVDLDAFKESGGPRPQERPRLDGSNLGYSGQKAGR